MSYTDSMTEVDYTTGTHVTTTEAVTIYHSNRPGSDEETRYRWVCSCGKRGKGKHPTPAAALGVSLDHRNPKKTKQKPPKPLSVQARFTRGVTLLAERGFTRDEIWQSINDLSSAMRQGAGLVGEAMSNIIDGALGTTSLEEEARALFEADPSSDLEVSWDLLSPWKQEGWKDIAFVKRQRELQEQEQS